MIELSKEENNKEFAELVHGYYKLASMRVMQVLREKYKIPKEEIHTLMMAIFSRLLNESCYSIGANMKNGYSINECYHKEHLLNLLKVLNNESLDQFSREDIDTQIESSKNKFREFVMENASDFYI